MFCFSTWKGIFWGSVLITGPPIYQNVEAVMASKAGQGVTKMIKRRCKFLTFRGFFGSVFFTQTARRCFFVQNRRERHINSNATKEVRYKRHTDELENML